MFCPKCGTQNPDTGKFCRSCGTGLGNVSEAISGKVGPGHHLVNYKGKRISWDSAISKLFMGAAFLTVSLILGFTGTGNGWWFWMLIPAFAMMGGGLAQYIQLKKAEGSTGAAFLPSTQQNLPVSQSAPSLPAPQTDFVPAADSLYKTGDLVPPSVTEDTTRHLDLDEEGKTMALPKD